MVSLNLPFSIGQFTLDLHKYIIQIRKGLCLGDAVNSLAMTDEYDKLMHSLENMLQIANKIYVKEEGVAIKSTFESQTISL